MAAGQLPLFMTGHEIQNAIGSNTLDKRSEENIGQMWSRKLKEAQAPGSSVSTRHPEGSTSLEESIRQRGGLNTSVRIVPKRTGFHLLDGHHRVAAAANIDPKMLVPIHWHADNVDYE